MVTISMTLLIDSIEASYSNNKYNVDFSTLSNIEL